MHQGKPSSQNGGQKPKAAPVSFLTQRTTDPDGFPRANGGAGMRARGLAEMVGNELFFAELHRNFVTLLQNLGRQFGGVIVEPPMSDQELRESFYEGQEEDEDEVAEEMLQSSVPKPVAVA